MVDASLEETLRQTVDEGILERFRNLIRTLQKSSPDSAKIFMNVFLSYLERSKKLGLNVEPLVDYNYLKKCGFTKALDKLVEMNTQIAIQFILSFPDAVSIGTTKGYVDMVLKLSKKKTKIAGVFAELFPYYAERVRTLNLDRRLADLNYLKKLGLLEVLEGLSLNAVKAILMSLADAIEMGIHEKYLNVMKKLLKEEQEYTADDFAILSFLAYKDGLLKEYVEIFEKLVKKRSLYKRHFLEQFLIVSKEGIAREYLDIIGELIKRKISPAEAFLSSFPEYFKLTKRFGLERKLMDLAYLKKLDFTNTLEKLAEKNFTVAKGFVKLFPYALKERTVKKYEKIFKKVAEESSLTISHGDFLQVTEKAFNRNLAKIFLNIMEKLYKRIEKAKYPSDIEEILDLKRKFVLMLSKTSDELFSDYILITKRLLEENISLARSFVHSSLHALKEGVEERFGNFLRRLFNENPSVMKYFLLSFREYIMKGKEFGLIDKLMSYDQLKEWGFIDILEKLDREGISGGEFLVEAIPTIVKEGVVKKYIDILERLIKISSSATQAFVEASPSYLREIKELGLDVTQLLDYDYLKKCNFIDTLKSLVDKRGIFVAKTFVELFPHVFKAGLVKEYIAIIKRLAEKNWDMVHGYILYFPEWMRESGELKVDPTLFFNYEFLEKQGFIRAMEKLKDGIREYIRGFPYAIKEGVTREYTGIVSILAEKSTSAAWRFTEAFPCAANLGVVGDYMHIVRELAERDVLLAKEFASIFRDIYIYKKKLIRKYISDIKKAIEKNYDKEYIYKKIRGYWKKIEKLYRKEQRETALMVYKMIRENIRRAFGEEDGIILVKIR